MPTSRLIDINTAAITYRRECLVALKNKKYRDCIGAIVSLNSLLPEDDEDHKYRIVIDGDEYYSKVKENYIIVCRKCEKEFSYDDVTFYNISYSLQDQIILGKPQQKIWICKNCKHENDLSESKIIQSSLQRPYYLRVVPEPPRKTSGLLSQFEFHQKMIDWVWLCLNALEDGFTRFRDDNWNKQDGYDELFDIDTTAEEST